MEKLTNAKALGFVLDNCEIPADVREKIENIKASIEKKNAKGSSGSRKPSAKQLENARLKEVVHSALLGAEPMTVTQIIGFVPELSGFSTQKVTPLLTSDLYTKEKVKGSNFYTAVEVATESEVAE